MNFKDTYKKNFSGSIKKFSSYEIQDNPILAFVHGASEAEIRSALKDDDWTDSEISALIQQARNAKNH